MKTFHVNITPQLNENLLTNSTIASNDDALTGAKPVEEWMNPHVKEPTENFIAVWEELVEAQRR